MPSLIYVTASSRDDALKMARVLVEEHLIACANILDGATSVYRWNGEVMEEPEAVLIMKTDSQLVSKVTDKILEIHNYDCPCVVSFEIGGGNPAFLNWIGAEVKDRAG